MKELEPLRLEPRFAEVIWGGHRLADALGKAAPPDRPIGESWEVFGANPIVGSTYAGLTLDEAARRDGPGILGTRVLARQAADDGFPLLIKFIDACLPLSVQVHPDDEFARKNEANSRGKTEAWYIVDAAADSRLVYGLRDGVDARRVAESVAGGELHHELTHVVVRPGDAVFVPAGTVHAISAGILLYEVQQRSEITYRLYDWGRVGSDGRPRELHVDKALSVIRFPQPVPRTTARLRISAAGMALSFLAACPHFALVAFEGTIDDRCDGSTFAVLSTVAGGARVLWNGGTEELALGQSVVLPAGLGDYRLDVSDGGRVLRATVPDIDRDVIKPLLAAGYSIDEVSGLGQVVSSA